MLFFNKWHKNFKILDTIWKCFKKFFLLHFLTAQACLLGEKIVAGILQIGAKSENFFFQSSLMTTLFK